MGTLTPLFVALVIATVSLRGLHVGGSSSKGSYKAAVVELAGESDPRPDNMDMNVEKTIAFIEEAKQNDVDIVIFPEMGIVGYGKLLPSMFIPLPGPEAKITPCLSNSSHAILERLSCAARENKIYVMVNVAEKSACSHGESGRCPTSGWKSYNTNIVFDRSGTIISRYRKSHLFGELETSTTDVPELATFDTDFGVRFGIMICFDLLFERPAMTLVRRLGVTDIIHSTAWFEILPFFGALQVQTAWAYNENVNFLTAGFNHPDQGSSGSGIMLGNMGLVNYTIPIEKQSTMITAVIPKKAPRPRHELEDQQDPDPHTELGYVESALAKNEDPTDVTSVDGKLLVRHEDISDMSNAPVDSLNPLKPLCHENFCCYFNASVESNGDNRTVYRAVVFKGVRPYFAIMTTAGYQICGIVACANSSLSSCGERFSSNARIKHLTISGTFSSIRATATPSTLTYSLGPLPVESFSFKKSCRHIDCSVQMSLHKGAHDLLTFAIFGRIFTMDGRSLPKNSSS